MIAVACVVVLATAIGIVTAGRARSAGAIARWILRAMLYVLVPFVAFVNVAHLHLTTGSVAGLGVAYLAIGVAGASAWVIGSKLWQLRKPALGALICSVIVANTGYLGLPMSVAVIGRSALGSAIAYDQLVSGPMLFVVAFAVGASFGVEEADAGRWRARSFLMRNPPLLAVAAGLLVPASTVPDPLLSASTVVVAALLPLGFFVVGVTLRREGEGYRGHLVELPDRKVVCAVSLRLLVAPALLLLTSATLLALPSAYVLQGAMPTGINSLVVGHAFGLDQRHIASTIVWSTAAVLSVGVIATVL